MVWFVTSCVRVLIGLQGFLGWAWDSRVFMGCKVFSLFSRFFWIFFSHVFLGAQEF